MTNHDRHHWGVARSRIIARMAELRLSAADLARASGLSEKHVRRLLNGDDITVPRDQTLWALCDALKWTADSIDLILDGGEPVAVIDESGEVSRSETLARRLAEIEEVATTGLVTLRNQQVEMGKFWRLLEQLTSDVRAVEAELAELRQAERRGDADRP